MRQSSQQVQKGPESVHCGVPLQLQGHGTLNRPRTKQTYIVCIRHRGLGIHVQKSATDEQAFAEQSRTWSCLSVSAATEDQPTRGGKWLQYPANQP